MMRRQIVLPAESSRVWEALTDPDQAEGWLGGRVDWDVREGASLTYRDDDGSVRQGQIEVVRPGRYLRFRWWPAESGSSAEHQPSEVSYLLEPDGEGTRLTIQEREVPADPPSAARASLDEGVQGAATASFSWSPWDSRVAGAWVSLAARDRVRA